MVVKMVSKSNSKINDLTKKKNKYSDLRTVLINIKIIRARSKNPDYIYLVLRSILF